MAKVGYARVSTEEQDLHLQLDALTAVGCVRIFQETASAHTAERDALKAVLDYLRDGNDTLVVWRFDRVARSLKDLLHLVERLQTRQIGFRSLTEDIDTSTAGGMLILQVFGALAEFERRLLRERTLAGLAAARKRGRVGGRPRKVTPDLLQMAMALMRDPEANARKVAALMGINRTVLYRYVNGDGSLKPLGQVLLGTRARHLDEAAD